MLVFNVLVCWLVIINLSLGSSRECTGEHPWNCDGGVNITVDDIILTQFLRRKQKMIAREFDRDEIEQRLNVMKHDQKKIPEFFDARIEWPMCKSLSRIKNQKECSTCWAFVSMMLSTDRLCISTKGQVQYDFSQQDVVTCCDKCFPKSSSPRCKTPASLVAPLMYIIKRGVGNSNCKPYDTEKLEDGCKKSCVKETMSYEKETLNISAIVFGLVNIEQPTSTLEDIQIEIMKYGPVGGRLDYTPESFDIEYTDEVFINRDTNPQDDGHAIKIIGWGTENEVPYWLCANSWGTKWGKLGGFFKIRRGTNELGVEKFFIAADTDPLNRPEMPDFNEDPATATERKSSSAISFTKILQFYKITIVVIVLKF